MQRAVLEQHSQLTMCTFGTRTSTSKPLPKVTGSSDENQPPIAEQMPKVSIPVLCYTIPIFINDYIVHIEQSFRHGCFGIIQ